MKIFMKTTEPRKIVFMDNFMMFHAIMGLDTSHTETIEQLVAFRLGRL